MRRVVRLLSVNASLKFEIDPHAAVPRVNNYALPCLANASLSHGAMLYNA